MESVGKIRRDHFRDGWSIKVIARARGVSRNTVRKVLRTGETAFEYTRRSPVSYPKLGRLTLTRIVELLRLDGYTGGIVKLTKG